jgi:hypothetical protein
MRKALLGTTALVAAGVIGAPAAEAAFDVQVHGNYTAAYALVDEDDDVGEAGYKRQNQTLNQDAEVPLPIYADLRQRPHRRRAGGARGRHAQ